MTSSNAFTLKRKIKNSAKKERYPVLKPKDDQTSYGDIKKKNIINVNTWLEPTQNHKAGVDDFDLQDSERFLRNCNVNKRSDPNVK